MKNLTAVFEITAGSNGIRMDAVFRLFVGIAILTSGIIGLIVRVMTNGRFPRKIYIPAFMIGWGIVWLIMHIPLWNIATSKTTKLLDDDRSGKSQRVEGIVHVTHEQPEGGHDTGDQINVDGKNFEINYFLVTPGYKRTISHGGVLKEGRRLHYEDGVILKVEIAQSGTGQPAAVVNRLEDNVKSHR